MLARSEYPGRQSLARSFRACQFRRLIAAQDYGLIGDQGRRLPLLKVICRDQRFIDRRMESNHSSEGTLNAFIKGAHSNIGCIDYRNISLRAFAFAVCQHPGAYTGAGGA
jgi:hypothetical protein